MTTADGLDPDHIRTLRDAQRDAGELLRQLRDRKPTEPTEPTDQKRVSDQEEQQS